MKKEEKIKQSDAGEASKHSFVHDDGWFKPEDKMQVCFMCDFVSVERHDRTLEKCPHCGFGMTQVDYFKFLVYDDKLKLITDPN